MEIRKLQVNVPEAIDDNKKLETNQQSSSESFGFAQDDLLEVAGNFSTAVENLFGHQKTEESVQEKLAQTIEALKDRVQNAAKFDIDPIEDWFD